MKPGRDGDGMGPPRVAEALLGALLPPEDREAILGDLAEEHGQRARERGSAAARRWYLGQLARSVFPALARRLRRRRREGRKPEGGEGAWRGALRDLEYALRTLRRRPGVTAVVLATLAVGIGSTTAVFSVADGVLLRPLPYPGAERIYHLWERTDDGRLSWISAPNFRDWREGLDSFEDVAAFTPSGFNVAGEAGPERTEGVEVTPGFFAVVGVDPARGRGFLPGEVGPPAARVAVISHGLWQRQFGGSPDAVGRTLDLEGLAYEVVGVLPPGGGYPADRDVWVPVDLSSATWKENRGTKWLMALGRLAEGVGPDAARAELEALGRALAGEHPDTNEGTGITAVPLRDELVGDVETPILVLLGAVALVLLVVCVNVSGLFVARAARRRREIAIRRSLGGSPGRIVRASLSEALVASLAGGALGVVLAHGGVRGLVALAPPGVPRLDEVAVNGRVLIFAVAVSVASGLISGLLPALQEAAADPRGGLLADGPAAGDGRVAARSGLVVAQVALAVVLVAGAGHLLATFHNLRAVDPGFEPEGAVAVRLPLTETRYRGAPEVAAFYDELLRRVRELPGVASAGVTWTLPMGGSHVGFSFELRDPPRSLDERDLHASYQSVSAGYFEAMGIPRVRGRVFREGEGPDDEPVAIVDEAFASRFFPGTDPVGQELLSLGDEWRRVVGVVGPVRRRGLQGEPEPAFYLPLRQDPRDAMTLVVRAERGDPTSLVPGIRRAVLEIDPGQPLVAPAPVAALVGRSLARPRFVATTVTLFGAVTLLLAALGIYGVISQLVTSRTREIGIRIALGARAGSVRGMMVTRGLALAGSGLAAGLLVAVPSIRLLRGVLYQVSPFEMEIAAAAGGLLLAMAAVASFLPARRATRVDPVRALRRE